MKEECEFYQSCVDWECAEGNDWESWEVAWWACEYCFRFSLVIEYWGIMRRFIRAFWSNVYKDWLEKVWKRICEYFKAESRFMYDDKSFYW